MATPHLPASSDLADAATLPPTPSGPADEAATIIGGSPSQADNGVARLPGYELFGELGRGGMGVVYKARHLQLNRLVAVKMILAGGHAGAADLARFRAEAEAIARLQHPHIVQIHDVGEYEGKPFFSLELCGGGSLEKKLNGTPLPAREAATLVETLARAMQAAHEQHVVHRDLKPANVLLADDGTPKITDFGLAKKLDEAGQTQSGAIMGTPSYMAPEQAGYQPGAQATGIGPACDVYALGAILYECLTGRPPFKAATALETIQQLVRDEPVSPTQLQTKTPHDLETICLKCLQKEAAKRFGSALELADDLRHFLNGEPIHARPVGPMERAAKWVKRNRVVTGAAVAVILALAIGTTVSYLKYLDAQKEAYKATKARDFLVSIFELSDANGQRGTMTARQILDDAEKRIPTEFADQPELQKELQAAIDGVYEKITANAPLAIILESSGTVQLQSTRDAKQRAVPQTLLYVGDRLSLGADANVQLVILSDLHKERLQPAREVTIRRKGCEPADAVREQDQDILMTFVRLPKETFYMGWDDTTKPAKKGVKTEIKEDFEIAVHDVTQGQWQAVMGENPSYFSRFGGGRLAVKNISDEELKLFPVENLSRNDAQEFIKKLNAQQSGRGWLYRLPTGAEWEYACRGGATSEEECSYHFYFDKPTNDLSSERANISGDFPFGNAPKGKNLGRPTRVGAYPPNKLGLCDMHGNVWQWCADPPTRVDRLPEARGGCWLLDGSFCRAGAYNNWDSSTPRSYFPGFRLVRVPVQ